MNKLFFLLLVTLLTGCGSDNGSTGSNVFSITNVNLTARALDFEIVHYQRKNVVANVSPLNKLNMTNLNMGSQSIFAYSVADSNTKETISNVIVSRLVGPERSRLFIAVPDTGTGKNKANIEMYTPYSSNTASLEKNVEIKIFNLSGDKTIYLDAYCNSSLTIDKTPFSYEPISGAGEATLSCSLTMGDLDKFVIKKKVSGSLDQVVQFITDPETTFSSGKQYNYIIYKDTAGLFKSRVIRADELI